MFHMCDMHRNPFIVLPTNNYDHQQQRSFRIVCHVYCGVTNYNVYIKKKTVNFIKVTHRFVASEQ